MVFLVPVVFFPEWCFQFPEGSVVPRVFSVPGLGCFQFPDSGLLFPEWCVGRPWVFSVPGMVLPVPGQGGQHGGVCGSRTVFLLASSCFCAFLCSLLPFFFSFLSSFLPLLPCFLLFLFPFVRSCLPPSFSPPALPLIFLRSFPFLLPALASFPSLSFPFRPLPEFPSRTCPSLP